MRSRGDETTSTLPCDIHETEKGYLLSFDLPGVQKENIKVETKGNTVTISAERKKESDEGGKGGFSPYRNERYYGSYRRSFSLPENIEEENIEAHYHDGVLQLSIPKSEETKARTISVKGGEGGFFKKLLT